MTSTIENTKLHTLLGDYPNTMALKKGEVTSSLVSFDFANVKVANTAFKPLVREAKFDVGEIGNRYVFAGKGLRQALCAHSGNGIGPRPAPHHRL